jgi:hypothetical protein
MTTLSNATSTVTAAKAPKGTKGIKAALNGSTAPKALTAAEAVEIAFEYGQNIAGQDGQLTIAFKTFAKNDKVIGDMVQALTEGYMVRKLGYTREEAKVVIGKAKYNDKNPDKNTDNNRTLVQEGVMVAVRMLVSRAKRFAGITKAPATAEQEATRAAKEAEAKAHTDRLIKADEIVNPADNVDVFDALNRMVLSMKAIQKKHTAKLVGDRGSEWRDWLANAPR